MILNFLQPVYLITVDVNEQRLAVVQPTENKRTHQMSNGFRRQGMAERANYFDLETCWTTDVVNMLHYRQSRVNLDPEIFDLVLKGHLKIANSQVVFLWHADPFTRSNQKSFGVQPLTSPPSASRFNTLLNVNNQWMKIRWSEDWWSWVPSANIWWPHLLLEMTLNVQSKEYRTQDWTTSNPVVKLLL